MSQETGPITPVRLIQILTGLGVPINAQLAAILAQLDVALSTRASEATVTAILVQVQAILAKMDNPADPITNDMLDRAARLLGMVSPVAGSLWDVSDRWARQLGLVDLSRVLGVALSAANPVIAGIYDAGANRMPAMDAVARPGFVDVIDRAARLAGTVSPVAASTWDVSDRAARVLGTVSPVAASVWDVSDRAARLMGVVYGSAAALLQVTSADALANPANALAATGFPHVFDATAGDWNRWLESPTQGIPYVEERPAAAIAVLADVVAAAAATQLIAASTPCRAVVVRALRANTGNIRVGGAGVLVGSGAELSAGDSVSLAVSNVNLVYIFGNGTDSVSITYVN